MFAAIAAILLLLISLGLKVSNINLFDLALAFWALHFAFGIAIPLGRVRSYRRR